MHTQWKKQPVAGSRGGWNEFFYTYLNRYDSIKCLNSFRLNAQIIFVPMIYIKYIFLGSSAKPTS
jgi:hypothetical protein